MRVISWNVNGLRAVLRKGFLEWLETCGADVVGLQEARCEEIPEELAKVPGWHLSLSPAQRKGYSGVALLSRRPWDSLETSLGPDYDPEGRLQIARFGRLLVVNGYFPNGNGPERDNSRVPFKLAFYQAVFDRLREERLAGAPILVMGDFNTAPTALDLARPKDNKNTSGFLPEERAEVARWLEAGWVDTFRREHEGQPAHYSWWSQRFNVRAKNIGWRIDLMLASDGLLPHVRKSFISKDVMGSDHCPIGVDLAPSVVG